jgi:hypothetical protein
MQPETLFNVFNFGVLPFWALLVFAPRWRWTHRLVHSGIVPALLGVVYFAGLIAVRAPEGAGGHSLAAAMRLFDSPALMFVCWIHYLTFDLFVGAWIGRDAIRRGLPHLAVVPCLIATLFYGPAGFLLYLVSRAAIERTTSLEEAPAA